MGELTREKAKKYQALKATPEGRAELEKCLLQHNKRLESALKAESAGTEEETLDRDRVMAGLHKNIEKEVRLNKPKYCVSGTPLYSFNLYLSTNQIFLLLRFLFLFVLT